MPSFGQIAISTATLISVALASVGGWFAQNKLLETKIEDGILQASEMVEITRAVNSVQDQDIAALKEAVETIKTDTTEMKRDIKEILRAVK